MPFTAIYGLPGKGKSLFQIQYGLRIAEQYRLRLVTNFLLNQYALAYYCKVNNYRWLFENLSKGIVYYISTNKNFAQVLQIPNSVILIDEFGLYAPSSQHWTLPPEAYNAIANNRKNLQHIVYAAQYPSQIHSSINEILTDVIYCEGQTVWDEKLRNERLMFKDTHAFGPGEFKVWFRDPKLRKNPVKVFVLAKKHWKGPLSAMDELTFKLYDSFSLLERQDERVDLKVSSFGYNPYIIDQFQEEKLGNDQLKQKGLTLTDLDKLAEAYSLAESKRKKRIYEASKIPPFLCLKLEGLNLIPPPHPFSGKLKALFDWLPASSYRGLKKLDLRLTKEFANYYKLSKAERQVFKQTIRWFLMGLILLLIFVLFL